SALACRSAGNHAEKRGGRTTGTVVLIECVAPAIKQRTNVPRGFLVALWGAVAVFAVATIGFAVVTQGVNSGNRIAAGDPSHLRWFTARRTTVIVDLAHLVSRLAAVGVLVPLGVIACLVLVRLGVRVVVAASP